MLASEALQQHLVAAETAGEAFEQACTQPAETDLPETAENFTSALQALQATIARHQPASLDAEASARIARLRQTSQRCGLLLALWQQYTHSALNLLTPNRGITHTYEADGTTATRIPGRHLAST